MWCTCGGKSFTVNVCDGEPNWDLWVCATCHKPSRMVFKKVTGMRCPKKALALLHIRSRTDGINEITWAVPGGRTKTLAFAAYPRKVGMAEQAVHLNKLWEMLDDAYSQVIEPSGPADALFYSKARCRTLCDTLSILMQPFYESSDDIAREAGQRYKAKQAGTDHETPGLGEAIWDPHTRWDGTPMAPETPQRAKPIAKAITNTTPLPPEAIPAVKQALKLKMMTVSQIAKMYGVSEDTVRAVDGS